MLMAGWSIQLLHCFRIKATLTCLIKALTLLSEDIQPLKLPLTAPRGTHTGGWPLVLLRHLQGDCVHLFVVAGSHGKHHYNAYPLWKAPCFSSQERSLCFLQWWGTTLSQSLLMTHSGITPLICRKVLSSPLIQSFLDCLCELVRPPGKKQSSCPCKKEGTADFQRLCITAFALLSFTSAHCSLYVNAFVPTLWVAYSARTHGHPLHTFTEKQSLAAFCTYTSIFLQHHLFTALCKHQ